jgi:hypothetical protein
MELVTTNQVNNEQTNENDKPDQQAIDLLNKMKNRDLKGVNEVC